MGWRFLYTDFNHFRDYRARLIGGKKSAHGAMKVNLGYILSGILMLLVGTLVYLIDRPPEQTWFVSILPVQLSLHHFYPPLFGELGKFLPDLLHVMAFIFLTAGIVNGGRKSCLVICLFWLVVDGAFELGQKYSTQAAALVPDWFDGIFLLENTRHYFIGGSYANHDMIAIIAGAIVAYLILIYSQDKRRTS